MSADDPLAQCIPAAYSCTFMGFRSAFAAVVRYRRSQDKHTARDQSSRFSTEPHDEPSLTFWVIAVLSHRVYREVDMTLISYERTVQELLKINGFGVMGSATLGASMPGSIVVEVGRRR
ncbi:hypothetical protein EDB19DRAFT_1866192 [Suillus lakei]|nr:hypothetical protein EDB19DRAFT_1866192 [Suillus lakei]